MTFYALYKVKEEGKEWKEAKEDLENFVAEGVFIFLLLNKKRGWMPRPQQGHPQGGINYVF